MKMFVRKKIKFENFPQLCLKKYKKDSIQFDNEKVLYQDKFFCHICTAIYCLKYKPNLVFIFLKYSTGTLGICIYKIRGRSALGEQEKLRNIVKVLNILI